MKPSHLPETGTAPLQIPLSPQNAYRRFFAWLLRRCGWTLAGEFPNLPKLVFIAAPHSSWWDGVWGLLFKAAVGLDASFMAKKELFAGPLGWLLRRMGGIAIVVVVALLMGEDPLQILGQITQQNASVNPQQQSAMPTGTPEEREFVRELGQGGAKNEQTLRVAEPNSWKLRKRL